MAGVLRTACRAAAAFTSRGAFAQQLRQAFTSAVEAPTVWVFLGPPGVGKGTYSVRVAKAFGMDHIAAGDLVRAEMKSGSQLGAEMKSIVDTGALLPDALILKVMRERMRLSSSRGITSFLLDGFPRTAEQADALEEIGNVQLALNLSLRQEILVEKCMGRRICKKCGSNYNIADIYLPATADQPEIVMPPLDPPTACLPHLEQRSDDNEPTIRRRLEVYHAAARPVEEFYAARGTLVDFEITGGIPETLPRLLEVLKGLPSQQEAAVA